MSDSTPSSPRPYRSALRAEQAAGTRRRVIGAALDLFGRQGYEATTFAQVARAAGVSVQTVQKHGPKFALLRAAVEQASFGVVGETDVFSTDVGRSLLAATDPDSLAGAVGDAVLAINAPSARVWMSFVGVAAGNDELARYHAEFLGLVRGQVERFLDLVADRGWLRDDIPVDELVEATCVLTSVEGYARFVLTDGLSDEQYRSFVARTVRESVFAR